MRVIGDKDTGPACAWFWEAADAQPDRKLVRPNTRQNNT